MDILMEREYKMWTLLFLHSTYLNRYPAHVQVCLWVQVCECAGHLQT